jgi:hypothetical protein
MDSPIRPGEITINSRNYRRHISPTVAGEVKKCGTIPRDFMRCPLGYIAHARAWDLELIPESEWQARLDEQIKDKAQLSNVRDTGMNGQPIPSRDQNGKGFCWAHSGVSAHLIARAVMGEPYADLSAYALACIIKKYRDEGGGAKVLSLKASAVVLQPSSGLSSR